MSRKASLALPVTIALIFGLGAAGICLLSNYGTTSVIDESKLYIGVAKSHNDGDVTLTITANSENGQVSKSLLSSELKPLSGQNENIVFYDYAESPLLPLNGMEVGYWLSDESNSISVSTSVEDVISSAEIGIGESGMWFVSLPTEAGAKPSTSHGYCYKTVIDIGGLA